MKFDLTTLSADIAYKVLASTIVPRPIAWVTSRSQAGTVNAAPYSFFNGMGSDPPTLVIGLLRDPVRGYKDTARNIIDTSEFVVNLVPECLAEAMNITCIDAPPDVSEIDLAGLHLTPSDTIAPPRITESPVAFECRSLTTLITGPKQTIVVARVLAAHIGDDYVLDKERAYIDTPKLGLVGRLHGSGVYTRTHDTFQLTRPTWAGWKGKPGG